eukprot:6492648-Amphidinium_carterae.1
MAYAGGDLRDTLCPFVVGPAWLYYTTEYGGKLTEALKGEIKKQTELVKALHSIHAGLVFNFSDLSTALGQIVAQRDPQGVWFEDENEEEEFKQVMAKRIRAMCRHVSQGRLKCPSAPWVVELGLGPFEKAVASEAPAHRLSSKTSPLKLVVEVCDGSNGGSSAHVEAVDGSNGGSSAHVEQADAEVDTDRAGGGGNEEEGPLDHGIEKEDLSAKKKDHHPERDGILFPRFSSVEICRCQLTYQSKVPH